MRTRNPIKVIVTAMSICALVPASALAFVHRRPHLSRHCAIGLSVAPREIVAGEPAIVFGRLRCVDSSRAAGQEVKLFHHLYGAPGFSYVQSATTDANGFYEFAGVDGTIDSNRSWYVRSQGAASGAKRIRVAAQVTLSGPAEGQLQTGFPNRVTFTGTVSPADAGARVILQRQSSTSGNRWHHIDSGVVDAAGNFTIVHTFIVPGDANIRVLVRSQGRNIASSSNLLAYSISQAQNPAMTILASADPIDFGQAVTISGKFANGAGLPVTLLARTVRQRGFAALAQVTTGPEGEYSFPAQSPMNSTFYRVVSSCRSAPHRRHCGGRASTVLYEGVRDVLSAQLSAESVQAGQSVTFSGTVSPDHTGHVVYLERQNASGSGFHPIQIAYVGAGSSYSIVHQMYVPGTKVLRVYIPGGPENQGVASPPFTVQVIAGPASALTPEAPGNSTEPAEGQF
jgi:hypothetical protein